MTTKESAAPVLILNQNAERETGRKAQKSNIEVARQVAALIRTSLGPQAMLKMLLDPMNGITCTSDGHAILREIDMAHPAAKTLLELCRTQDEEVGDGTTSVIILAGEILSVTSGLLDKKFHPVSIINAYKKALDEILKIVTACSKPIDLSSDAEMLKLIKPTIGTKIGSQWNDFLCDISLRAVKTVTRDQGPHKEIDIKRYIRIEKIPGGTIDDSELIDGVVINKDILHPQMRRRIENPRILLLDCPLEYKKGESNTNLEISRDGDWNSFLRIEEEQVRDVCEKIIAFKPDVVVCEKGVSDLAQHYLLNANISVLRRLKKSDNNRIARATGATIINQVDDIRESEIGTKCGLFEVRLIANEYFAFFEDCKDPKACSIILRGPSKDIINEIERNLHDAMAVTRNLMLNPTLLPGGGAIEAKISVELEKKALEMETIDKYAFNALSRAFEVIPRILIQNAGANPTSLVIDLKAKIAASSLDLWGIDGIKGQIVKNGDEGSILESTAVKVQTFKSAIEATCMILRVDDILSGLNKKPEKSSGPVVEEEPIQAD
jgi:T-complex protein 1 subunit gamma